MTAHPTPVHAIRGDESLTPAPQLSAGSRQIRWYRTPIDRDLLRELSQRSDAKGAAQTLGYLGLYATTAGLAIFAAGHLPVAVTVLACFAHGTVAAFMINGVHELGHGSVFKTRALNAFFVRVLAFLGWINFQVFAQSHTRHHAYTLHPPQDLEVVLPLRLGLSHVLLNGFVSPQGAWRTLRETIRIARGRFRGAWELTLYPESAPEKRKPAQRWACVLLAGHALIAGIAIALGWWMVPVVITLAPFYGGVLFFLCNNTQHIGLRANVPDFRLCCRTFTVNPVVRVLYWQMNYHTEHHMYPTVPCYNLGRLHRAVRDDLPPCPRGLIATWRDILAILRKQEGDPAYQHQALIPIRPSSAANF